MNIGDITFTSIETITAFDLTTGNYKFTLDELQNASINQTQDKSDITGKQGRKLSSLKRNKAVTVSGANGLISGGLLEMQTGCSFETKPTEVLWTDYLQVSGGKAETKFKAVGTTGAEIRSLFIRKKDGTQGTALTQGAAVGKGIFTYSPDTKELAFDADITDGTEIVVHYNRRIVADTLVNRSDKYSEKCMLYIDAFGEIKCGDTFRIQIFIPKADFSGEFGIEFGENQSVHNFEAEALSGACGTAGEFFTYTVYGANTDDYGNIIEDGGKTTNDEGVGE